MSFFISDAFADAAAPAAQGDSTFSLVMLAAIFVLFYFMIIRPQNKRAKEHRDLITKIKKGDEVVLSGGILAKVVHVGEQYIKLSPAENVEINVQKGSVTAILPKGTIKSL